jgi:PEGA domain
LNTPAVRARRFGCAAVNLLLRFELGPVAPHCGRSYGQCGANRAVARARPTGERMHRVAAVVASSLALAGCGGLSMPSVSMPTFLSSRPSVLTASVRVESEPPGAEARMSTGQGCRTPCLLSVSAANEFTLDVSLNGYVPQVVTGRVVPGEDARGDSEFGALGGGPRVVPNPIFVVLEPSPPPEPPARRKLPPPKRTVRPAPTPLPPSAAAPSPFPPAR